MNDGYYEIEGYEIEGYDDEELYELVEGDDDGSALLYAEEDDEETGFYIPGMIPALDNALGVNLGGGGSKPALRLPTKKGPARRPVRPVRRIVRKASPRRPQLRRMGAPGSAGSFRPLPFGQGGVREMPFRKKLKRVLAVNSNGNVTAGSAATVSVIPQLLFKPERFVIDSQEASSWLITDIKNGVESMFANAGQIPGGMFRPDAAEIGIEFSTVQAGITLAVQVVNVSGVDKPFIGAFIGEAVN